MKTDVKSSLQSGFTLIEMVGVIAVIGLLVAILLPRVFAAIDNARFDQTVASLNATSAATVGYFGKYGRFGEVGGSALTTSATNWDNVLIAEHYLEAGFHSRLCEKSSIQVLTVPTGATPGVNGCFSLTGAQTDAFPAGTKVVVAILEGVSPAEARELSLRLDGADLTPGDTTTADRAGRVTYPVGANVVTVYLSHL